MSIKYSSIIIFVLLLVFIGGAYASEINETADALDIAGNEPLEELSVDNQEILSTDGDSFSDLQDEIDTNDNIVLNKNYTFDETKDMVILIDKNMTIDGDGHVIDAVGKSSIFYINATSVTLKNIIFLNGNSTDGGAIQFNNTGTAVLENCKFINTQSENAAVFFTGGDLTIVNCEFLNSSVNYYPSLETDSGDSIVLSSATSMIYVNSTGNVVISKSKFKNSTFLDYGINIEHAEHVELEENEFDDNLVYAKEYYVDEDKFYECGYYVGYVLGNANTLINIHASDIKLSNSKFENNNLGILTRIVADNLIVDDYQVRDSNIAGALESNINAVADINHMGFENISSIFYHYYWNSEIDDYVNETEFVGECLISIHSTDSNGGIIYANNISMKDISIKDCGPIPESLLSLSGNNLTIHNIDVADIQTNRKEIHWDDQYGYIENDDSSAFEGLSIDGININISDINIDNVEAGMFEFMRIQNTGNLSASNLSATNLKVGAAEAFMHISNNGQFNSTVGIKSLYFDNIEMVGLNMTYFDSGTYYTDYTIEGGLVPVCLEGSENTSVAICDVYVNNSCISSLINVYCANDVDINNVSAYNSHVLYEESMIWVESKGNVSIEEIAVDNITIRESEYVSQQDGVTTGGMKYIESANIGMHVHSSDGGVSLKNINITNSESVGGNGLFEVQAYNNITAENISVINISDKAKVMSYYDSWLGMWVYSNVSGDSFNGLNFYSIKGNISLIDLNIDNVISGGQGYFLSVFAENSDVIINNTSIVNSKMNGGEVSGSIEISAGNNVILSNFVGDNISPVGRNSTDYMSNYFKYVYDYQLDIYAGFGITILAGNTTNVSNVSFTNIANGGGYDGILHVSSQNIFADNILVENVTSANRTTISYNPDLARYTYTMETTECSNGFVFDSRGIVNVTNIKFNNTVSSSYNQFFDIGGGDVTIENVSLLNSKISGGEGAGIYISAQNNTYLNNIILDNLSAALARNSTAYDSNAGKYIWEAESNSEGGPVGIHVDAGYNATLYNLTISNTCDASYELIFIGANNIVADNIKLENVSQSDQVYYEYDYNLGTYIYQISSGEIGCYIDFSGENNVNVTNFNIVNLTMVGDEGAIEISGNNVSVDNFTIFDSSISGEEGGGLYINANDCINFQNFIADNISQGPGTNYTYYNHQYGRYVYDYQSLYGGFAVVLNSGNNLTANNITLTNIEGGSWDGILSFSAVDVYVDDVLIENVTSSYCYKITYYPNLGKHIVEWNQSCGFNGGISEWSDGGISKFYNIVINNVPVCGEESPVFIIHNDEIVLENITLSNVTAEGYYYSYYDSSTNNYYISISTEFEEMIYFDADKTIDIKNMLVDNIPAIYYPVSISAENVTIDNATVKNIVSGAKDYQFDPSVSNELVIVSETNEAEVVYVSCKNILISNSNFENITVGASKEEGAVLYIYSTNYSFVDNCSFKDIKIQNYYYYTFDMWSGTSQNETMESYGGVIKFEKDSANINGSRFINCSSTYGGAVYAVNPLNITNSEFIDCSAELGGAIYVDGFGLLINNTNFTGNNATNGGAIFFTNQSFNNTVYNAVFLKNLAEHNGGALYIYETTEDGVNVINASAFYLNHANFNGGAFFFNDTINRIVWDDYRWHNATASSKIHDDLTFISQPLKRTMIIFNEFEENSDYSLEIIARNMAVGGNHTVIINIDEAAEGYVYVNVTDMDGNFIKDKDGVEINGYYLLENGRVTLELEPLAIGDYNVCANYSSWDYDEDPLYYHINATIFSVYPHDLNVTANKTVFADENVTVVANLNNLTAGTVNITVTNATHTFTYSEIPVVNGTVIYNVTGFYAGYYNVTVTYNGDDIFYPKSNTTSFKVIQREPKVDVSVRDNVYGNITKIIVEVPVNQTGNVTVKINNQTYTKEVTNGTVEFEIPGLTAGEWTANVTFNENRIYAENTTLFNFNVSKANFTAEVVGRNVTVKENASFIIGVPDDFTGNVTIEIDNVIYYDGPVSDLINITKFLAGNYTANLEFYGDKNYNDAKAQANFTVASVEPTMIVTITNATYGGNATATITVSGNANGTVNITVDGKNYTGEVKNGEATVQLTNVAAGDKEAEVKFITSDRYNSNTTANATFTVAKNNSTVLISQNGNDVIITVPEDATGNVTVYVGIEEYSKQIVNGTVTLEDVLMIGNNSVIALYDGDGNYLGNKNSTLLLYNLDSLVNASATNSVYGNTSTVTVNVPIGETGYILITVDNITYGSLINDGMAVFNITGLDVGEYDVYVLYLGDGSYTKATNVTSFNVTKATLGASVIPLNITILDNASFIIDNAGDFKGKVNITVDGETYVRDFSSLIDIPKLTEGNKVANVVFWNDSNYYDLALTAPFKVSNASSIEIASIKADNMTRGWNSEFDYQAAFLNKDGSALKNAEVKFVVKGKEYTAKTNDDGIAHLTGSKLNVGTYSITSVNPVTNEEVTATLTIVERITENEDFVMDYRDGSKFVVKVFGDDGNIAPKGEIISFYVNGIYYVAKVDSKGYARLTVKLLPKTYKITAEYKGFKTTNKLEIKQILKPVKKTTKIKKSKKSFKLKASLKYSNGKALKGKVITFKIKGKTLKAKTNKKGIATVKVKKKIIKKLKKGKKYKVVIAYTVKEKYGNDRVPVSDKVKCYVKVKK